MQPKFSKKFIVFTFRIRGNGCRLAIYCVCLTFIYLQANQYIMLRVGQENNASVHFMGLKRKNLHAGNMNTFGWRDMNDPSILCSDGFFILILCKTSLFYILTCLKALAYSKHLTIHLISLIHLNNRLKQFSNNCT